MIDIFVKVYLVNGVTIRKIPLSLGPIDDEAHPVLREAIIYRILEDHPRIARCISRGRMDLVEAEHYPNGHLLEFSQRYKASAELQSRWFQQIIEAVVAIHQYGVIHSDLVLRQFFVDDGLNLHLGDFTASQYPGHPALGYEQATHCLPRDTEEPNTMMSDIFALGSTLFELVTGKVPFAELYPVEPKEIAQSHDPAIVRARLQRKDDADREVGRRFQKRVFPAVTQIYGGDIILACWRGKFSSAKEVLQAYESAYH
ncbi:uncharacterized protein N7515_003849 [Penicillium bovifimosum]|uniref:Protein kinase domain-containing protein n=1 Tax=Penicillium bovifimosum TaxID=126998 RepID=A0A9W9H5X3_9EURO|nr:uncharacterized protein N7515_003849 [Penicillium bovifimosum]KAJ5139001.1 hypothetical protein N7515_003849 [Penicillium bovifimosum]